MIIFDTNAVNLLPPEGPRADIIRKLRQSGHHRVAVPWMVLEEMAAHQARFYPDKHQAVIHTLKRLREVLPWELQSSLEPLDLDRFLDHWRDVYREIFEVIETSGEVARKALAREAMALRPAKRAKDHSVGARDAAIWFSILEFLKENPDEHVYFVTDNTSDFGDGSVYQYPMNEDLQGLGDRLTQLRDFDEVVSQFTEEVSGKDAEAAAEKLLRSLSVRGRVAETAVGVLSSTTGFMGLGAADAAVEWSGWALSPEAELLRVTDVTGHGIEGDVWYTANARWLLYGLAADGPEAPAQYVACVWEMKVLFSTREGDETPTLLTTSEPSAPDTADTATMDILQRLKKRADYSYREVMKDFRAVVSPVDHRPTQQIAASLAKLDIATGPAQQLAEQFAASQKALAQLAQTHNSGIQQALNTLAASQRAVYDGPLQKALAQLAQTYISGIHDSLKLFAASQAKLDIAATLPRTDFARLTSMARDFDEGEQEEDKPPSPSDADSKTGDN